MDLRASKLMNEKKLKEMRDLDLSLFWALTIGNLNG